MIKQHTRRVLGHPTTGSAANSKQSSCRHDRVVPEQQQKSSIGANFPHLASLALSSVAIDRLYHIAACDLSLAMLPMRARLVVLVLVVLAAASAVTAKLQPESDSPGERSDPPGFSNGRATRRYIVGLEASSPRSRAQARAAVTATITGSGGDVVLESLDEDNPFVVFEASSAEHASAIAQLARTTRGEHCSAVGCLRGTSGCTGGALVLSCCQLSATAPRASTCVANCQRMYLQVQPLLSATRFGTPWAGDWLLLPTLKLSWPPPLQP